jgi:hypothetical protein
MRELCIWVGLAVATTAGIVAACHNEVPGPQLPMPHRELPPQGDKPMRVMPKPVITIDGGVQPTTVIKTQPIFAASAFDAAVDAD